MQDTLRKVTERVFFNEQNIKSTFPGVPVLVMITCGQSLTSPLLGYHFFTTACKEKRAKGEFIRPISIEIKREANHLVCFFFHIRFKDLLWLIRVCVNNSGIGSAQTNF
jgi:hypothetical protein